MILPIRWQNDYKEANKQTMGAVERCGSNCSLDQSSTLTAGPTVGMMGAVLPVRWACPGTPAPAPTGPLHTGQSDSQPEWHTFYRLTKKTLSAFKPYKHSETRQSQIIRDFNP